MAYETITIDGHFLRVWPNTNPYKDDGFAISDIGGWIAGLYDSKETSIAAYKITHKENGYDFLSNLSMKINTIDGENRLINMSDLGAFHD